MNRFTTLDTTIGDFFNQKDTIFRVPLYQREYSWSEENVYTLLEDLLTSESYFLGTFVLNNEFFKEDRAKDIVDGQQRILTITIFWAVIRDIFLELKDKEKSNQIQSNYISNKDDDGNDEFKVSASNSASIFFQKNIQIEKQKIEEADPKTDEHKSIIRSYQIIKEELHKELSKYETNQQKIEKLRKVRDLLKALQLIVIEVESEEDTFVFFETLNSRGTELSQSDLIKNHIFKNINKKKRAH